MPTVSNHDVLGTLSWGTGGNARHFTRDPFGEPLGGRSDARDGINSLLFGDSQSGGGRGAGPCGPGQPVQAEHAYASAQGVQQVQPQQQPQLGSFVSQNGYYGYQQPHAGHTEQGLALAAHADCSMDTSENNLPGHAAGAHPSCGGFGGPWQADPRSGPGADPINRIQRKRNLSARGMGLEATAALAAHDDHGACKRTRPSPFGEHNQHHTGASTQAMVHGYGVPSSTPSIAEQSLSPAQMYDLPTQQLPGSTSQLVDMSPRPRCLMGHFI